MTTPEQLATWREEARTEYLNDDNIRVEDIAEEHYVCGYLRAKQETEQARAIGSSKIVVEIIREAIEIILDPSKIRHPIVDEMEGIALMLETQASGNEQARKDERKQTLEEAIAICLEAGHSEDQDDIAEKIKELLND